MATEVTDANLLQLLRDLPAYRRLGGEIGRKRRELRALIAEANRQGRQDKLARLQQLYDENLVLLSNWTKWDNRIDWIEGQLARAGINVDFGGGLGVPIIIPVIVAGAISATVIGMAAVTASYLNQRNMLQGIKEGWLPADWQPPGGFDPFGGLTKNVTGLLMVGAALFFLPQIMRQARR